MDQLNTRKVQARPGGPYQPRDDFNLQFQRPGTDTVTTGREVISPMPFTQAPLTPTPLTTMPATFRAVPQPAFEGRRVSDYKRGSMIMECEYNAEILE